MLVQDHGADRVQLIYSAASGLLTTRWQLSCEMTPRLSAAGVETQRVRHSKQVAMPALRCEIWCSTSAGGIS
jgi:hypothetical protein